MYNCLFQKVDFDKNNGVIVVVLLPYTAVMLIKANLILRNDIVRLHFYPEWLKIVALTTRRMPNSKQTPRNRNQ